MINALRKLDDKPPLKFEKGIGHVRDEKVLSVLVDDLVRPSELAKTMRLVGVFCRHHEGTLKAYAKLLDFELKAYEKGGLFSESTLNRFFIANVLFAVGIATVWSTFVAHFLGLDVLKTI